MKIIVTTKKKKSKLHKEICSILKNPPTTWKPYQGTAAGRLGIVDMEFGEFRDAVAANSESTRHELKHLCAAALYALKHMEDN